MEKVTLKNGLTVVCQKLNKPTTVSLTMNVGHVNEPSLGLAALFENTLLQESAGIQAVYGGTITTYFTGVITDVDDSIHRLANLVIAPFLSDEVIKVAAGDIIAHTRDLAPLPKRQMKLLYKHTAFGNANKVWDADVYVDAVSSYQAKDLEAFASRCVTGKNLVLAVTGIDADIDKVKEIAEKYFGNLPCGRRHKVQNNLYTGGFGRISATGGYRQVMLGWDVSGLANVAEANVLMSMLSGRLERSFIGKDVDIEVKIAGYYGLRTLRVSVTSHNEEDVNEFIDIICANVRRLRTTLASDRRMESSRNRAMAEKLFTFSQPQDSAVEIAWQTLGRGDMYNISERINATWQVSARDVQDIAEEIFSQPLTYVTYCRKPHYSYYEVCSKL